MELAYKRWWVDKSPENLNYVVRELEPKEGASPWQVAVRVLEPGEDFDRVVRKGGQLEASAHGRMERLLRQTGGDELGEGHLVAF